MGYCGLAYNFAGMLKTGKLDVIILALSFEEPDILTAALNDEPFQAAVPAGNPSQKQKSLDSRQLSSEKSCCLMPIIVFDNKSWRHVLSSVDQTQELARKFPRNHPTDGRLWV